MPRPYTNTPVHYEYPCMASNPVYYDPTFCEHLRNYEQRCMLQTPLYLINIPLYSEQPCMLRPHVLRAPPQLRTAHTPVPYKYPCIAGNPVYYDPTSCGILHNYEQRCMLRPYMIISILQAPLCITNTLVSWVSQVTANSPISRAPLYTLPVDIVALRTPLLAVIQLLFLI